MRRARAEGGTLVNKGIQHARRRRNIGDRREIERYQKNQEKGGVTKTTLTYHFVEKFTNHC